MILTNWPEAVNSNFFSLSYKPKENTEETSYISGRVVAWQKNSKKTMVFSGKLLLDVNSELPYFWSWFNDTLGQTAGAFTCAAIGTAAYRFTSVPEPEDTDNFKRVINLEFEEV